MNRRQFVTSTSTAALSLAAGCATATSSGQAGGIIDTHTHFYDPHRPQGVPWPPPNDPVLSRTILPAEFVELTRPLGVTGTVAVEASSWVEDNQWLLDLAEQNPIILGVVGNLKPGEPEFAGQLQRFARNPLFRGIRIGDDSLQAALKPGRAQDDLRRLADRDLTLDLLIPPQHLPQAAELSDQVRHLRVVVDHCANVPVGSPPTNEWVGGLSACHYAPNVFLKVSGLVEGTGQRDQKASTDPQAYSSVIEAVWHSFGPERLIFGSNWPVCLHFASYATVLQIVKSYFAQRGPEASHQFFHSNAIRIYRLKSR